MTLYRTLETVNYVEGNTVIEILRPGIIVELNDTQAAALRGKLAYVGSLDDLPEARVLYYTTYASFPAFGDEGTLYLAQDSGKLYQWSALAAAYSLASSEAGGSATAFNVKDYGAVGNGVTNDTAAFNAAKVAAGVGGHIYVPPGTYIVNNAALSLAHQEWNLAPGAHLKLPAGATNGAIVTVTGDYVTLDGGEWDGNRTNVATQVYEAPITVTAAHCTVRNAYVHDTDGYGILFHPATTASTIDGSVVENCTLVDNVGSGVTFDCVTFGDVSVPSHDVRVSGCTVLNSIAGLHNWTAIGFDGGTAHYLQGAVVENCYVEQLIAGAGGYLQEAIHPRYVRGFQVTGCYVSGTDLCYSVDVCTDIVVSACNAYGGRLCGIEVAGDNVRMTITGCTVDGAGVGSVGILGDNATNDELTITGNTISNLTPVGGKGISMQTGGRSWTIAGNVFRTPGTGIEIYGAATTNLTIAGNTLEMAAGGTGGFYCGIYLDPFTTGARGWSVKNNNLIGWSTNGILVEHVASPVTASNVTVRGNTYTNTGSILTLNNVTFDGTCVAEDWGVAYATLTGTEVLTNKTLTTPTLTTPKIDAIKDTNGNTALGLGATASAVNNVKVINGATGGPVQVYVEGSDSAVELMLRPRGTSGGAGFVSIVDGAATNVAHFRSSSTPVNFWRFFSSDTGQALEMDATGSDTNLSINFVPKGAGAVQQNGVPVVTTTGAQTLTSKTLTAPKVSSSGGVAAPIDLQTSGGNRWTIRKTDDAESSSFVGSNFQIVGYNNSGAGSFIGMSINRDTGFGDFNYGLTVGGAHPVATVDGAQALTNKRITPRIGTVASSATPTINTNNVDQFNITLLTTAITSFTTNLGGTPADGECLDVRITGDATPRAIAWGASFTGTLLTTTAASKTHLQRLKWDAAASKWAGYLADATGY